MTVFSQNEDLNNHLLLFKLDNSIANLKLEKKSNDITVFKIEEEHNLSDGLSTKIMISELQMMESPKMTKETITKILESFQSNGYKLSNQKIRHYIKNGGTYNHSKFIETPITYNNQNGVLYVAMVLERHASLMFIGVTFTTPLKNKKIFTDIVSSAELKLNK